MSNLKGKTLGQYRILEKIGQGGMGTVYKAWDSVHTRYVAIKVLFPHFSNDPVFLKRFQREAQAIRGLNHPHIVDVYEAGRADGLNFIAMEYIDGGSLEDLMRSRRPLNLNTVINIVRQVALALDYAHSRGIVHRDIKPQNILLSSDGRATLTDFGIAMMVDFSRLTASGVLVGTPCYMAPEQAEEGPIDRRADIYSLGIVCYEMLTGRVPFTRESPHAILYAHVHETPPLLRRWNSRLPAKVERVVMRALAKKPAHRYPSAGQFAEALVAATNWPRPKSVPVSKAKGTGRAAVSTPRVISAPFIWLWMVPIIFLAVVLGALILRPSDGGGFLPPMPPTQSPSPEGKIVFESDWEGNKEICVMDTDGRDWKRLTYDPSTDWAPAWSPDGQRITFVSERDGNMEIYVMNADGSGQMNLTHNPALDSGPAWSPDDRKIAFDSDRDGNVEIYVMNSDGSNPINLTRHPAFDGDPAWSPKGTRIAFESDRDGNYEIYMMDVNGDHPTRLTTNIWRDFGPAWSPDSSKIAFECQREGGPEICVLDSDGSNLRRLTINSVEDRQPAWSPDGTEIVFARERASGDLWDIWVMKSDGSEQRWISISSVSGTAPSWYH